MISIKFRYSAFAGLVLFAGSAFAIDIDYSGFSQLTVGGVLNGSPSINAPNSNPYTFSGKPGTNYKCPCFIGNNERAGVYQTGQVEITPESLVGVQGDFKFNSDLSATVQLVARTVDSVDTHDFAGVSVDWAYGTYNISNNLKFQFGLKRLPLYYYSDFMYVGYAYPWIRPPQDIYGWQIYSYYGGNLLYTGNVDDWTVTANIWAGNKSDSDNTELGKLYYTTQIKENWKNMIGSYINVSNDIVTTRVEYMHAEVERYAIVNGTQSLAMSDSNGNPVNDVGQDFYGLAFNLDYDNWLLRNEVNFVNRPSVRDSYLTQAYSGGYQLGEHTLMLTWSRFAEHVDISRQPLKTATESLTYRWDFAKSQALKVQYDQVRDESYFEFVGNSNMVSASWQTVF